jgi:RNA polymerase sigma-70 factor (ECF subfamily)
MTEDAGASFRVIYEDQRAMILRYLIGLVGDAATAEDLCAETFCRAWDAWPRYRPDRDSPRPWLIRIARNLAADQGRRRRLVRFIPLLADTDRPVAGHEDRTVDRVLLRDALARLSGTERDMLALRAAGFSHAEIGSLQGRSEDAVKMAWVRALRRLRAEIGER